ncbi:MAG: zinc metalloprotease [Thermoanaerobaculia bacterium]|nr:zinc metalloprotease [Thermoanaerobaculia bacterium]
MSKKIAASLALAVLATVAPSLAEDADAVERTVSYDTFMLGEDGSIVPANRCGAPDRSTDMRAKVEAELANYVARFGAPEAGGSIPVAFHVVYKKKRNTTTGNISQAMIDDQIDVLNAAYQGTGFSFHLASVDRTNNNRWFTGCYGSQERRMKQALTIDPATTLNIYSCQPGQGILGYSYLPETFPESSYYHGVVVLHSSLPGGSAAPYNLGDTATHEVGHYLGLEHTFQGGCSNPGDGVADTAPEASAAFGCPVGRDTCSGGGPDPIFNFMDYTDDSCMDEFSNGQGSRMQSMVSVYKPSL